jgi:hypothetical protein
MKMCSEVFMACAGAAVSLERTDGCSTVSNASAGVVVNGWVAIARDGMRLEIAFVIDGFVVFAALVKEGESERGWDGDQCNGRGNRERGAFVNMMTHGG